MPSDELISRQEILAGLPAKRAQTLLYLIESQTANLVARSRVEFSLTDTKTVSDRNLAFLSAFTLGRQPALHLTIQDLECFAPQWMILVPANPRLKAAVARILSHKYKFTARSIPQIRAVLGLDETDTQRSYSNSYNKPLETIYTTRLSWLEQLRWLAAAIAQRLESLPPFWIASAITVALGLPQAFLALPVAGAEIGPLATIGLAIGLGIINILTMVCMAEAIGRSGDFRYGNGFIKQLALNYLGNTGSLLLSLAVGMRVFLIALACYIGLSATMADFTPIPATVWSVLLFVASLFLRSRRSLSFTVTVMVLLAGINVSLLLFLSLLAYGHVQLDNLLYINLPLLNGQAIARQTVQQILGVSLMLYFGHIYVGECAKIILPRDPSATSLIWGSVAGTAFLTLLFCIWVLAVNGAIPPQVLSGYSGTALEPLAQQIGVVARILGSVLVALLLGMAWLRSSSLLMNLTREWLPSRSHSSLILPCQQGRLILHPRDRSSCMPHFGLTYLGLAMAGSEIDRPQFRLDMQLNGKIYRVEFTFSDRWQIETLFARFPELQQSKICLTLEIVCAYSDRVHLQITSPMTLAYTGSAIELVESGGAEEQRGRGQKAEGNLSSLLTLKRFPQRLWLSLLNQRHFLLSVSPLIAVFLLAEWLFLAGTQSFTNVLAFAGVLGNSLVGGIFPVLLLAASRRKGEFVPGVVLPLLDRPLAIAGIYSLFLAILLFHGLVIWENPFARSCALGATLLAIGSTIAMQHSGAFISRSILELRTEQRSDGKAIFNLTAGGRPQVAQIKLKYATEEQLYVAATVEIPSLSALQSANFKFPNGHREELRVWVHQVQPNSYGEIPMLLAVDSDRQTMEFDLQLSQGQILIPPSSDRRSLQLTVISDQ